MAVFATVLALAACGADVPEDPSLTVGPSLPTGGAESDSGESSDESDPTATPPTATPAVATPPETTETSEATENPAEPTRADAETDDLPDFAGPGEQQTQDAAGQAQLIVDDVRVGPHDGFDRTVLDLSGTGEVGWRAEYVTDPALEGSGAPVDLAGEFVLQVTVQGMAYPEAGDTAYEEGELLVDGGDLATVTEILRTVPFEGQLPVFIGTSAEAPFRVFRLSEPERLVIDVQH